MIKSTENAILVRRENDDRRTSGGGNDGYTCFQRHIKHYPMDDDLYDKIPSYMTAFSHGAIVPIKDHNDILNEVIVNSGDCLKRNLYSLPCLFGDTQKEDRIDEYCRLPAYTMDLSQSLLYDDDFEGRIPAMKTVKPNVILPKRNKQKQCEISKESTDLRRVVFIGNVPLNWCDPREKIDLIIRNEVTPSVTQSLIRIDVKSRFHNHLDSYAFIHFSEHDAAFVTLDFFQNHSEYKKFNASFAGRDKYYLGKKYSDIDGFQSLMEKIRY